MKITNNKVVSITYDLKTKESEGEETLVETADQENPMVFIFGASGLPEKFENELEGLEEGASFNFTVDAEEGYGDFDENAIVSIPKNVFEVDGKVDEDMLQVGNYLPMADNQGNHMQGRVVEIDDDTVQMDFNHPLAGMAMHFDGKVVGVRDATSEEIAHGHVHGEGGVYH